ncbi:MAG: EamA family transporter RarD [Acidaminococcaceae bacterium]|nr:EamA family transporter RarD [Acidaminococcaceae bacterium]
MSEQRSGVLYGLAAYILWGVLPVYWKQLQSVSAFEILANRFIWSAVFVFILLVGTGKVQVFREEVKAIFSNVASAVRMMCAAVLISFNWGIFIWAVEQGRIVETSMGYYINPLVSVLFGVMFLRERLDKLQLIAVFFAFCGIGIILWSQGELPWISVSLATTFALYGLLKKIIKASALTSIMLETLFISPLALAYIYYLNSMEISAYQSGEPLTIALLVGAGAATATPLLLFTMSARLLPLNLVGFMQYLSPTISLFLGIFLYGEDFTASHLAAFAAIWIGLGFFIWSQLRVR